MARYILKILQQMLQDFKVCLIILGGYALSVKLTLIWVAF